MSKKHITVHSAITQAELNQLALNASIALDVTALDPSRLPIHVKAVLCTDMNAFDAPQLLSSGNIVANGVTDFNVPQLQNCGDIFANGAISLHAQAGPVPSLHLRLYAPTRPTSGRIRNAGIFSRCPEFRSSNGVGPPVQEEVGTSTDLIRAGLATAERETMNAGAGPVEAVRLRITAAGRKAIEE
jgi:hypothetical protein